MSFGLNSSSTKYSNTQSQQQAGTSTTTRNLTPYQTALQAPTFDYVSKLMTDPMSMLAPYQTAARNSTNASYSGLADSLRQKFMGTGGGASGKFGGALAQGELDRLGKLSDVDTQFQQQASQMPLTAMQIAQALLGMNFGQTTDMSGTSSGTGSGNSSTSGWSFGVNGGVSGGMGSPMSWFL